MFITKYFEVFISPGVAPEISHSLSLITGLLYEKQGRSYLVTEVLSLTFTHFLTTVSDFCYKTKK